MAVISSVLIDKDTDILAPCVIDLTTFEIKPISSTIDMIASFEPTEVGIFYYDELRIYKINKNEHNQYFVANNVAKKSMLGFGNSTRKKAGQELLQCDEIIKSQKSLQDATGNKSPPGKHKL